MNKHDNKLALSVLTTLIAAIALIYTLIMYRNIIFAVIGTSVLFLITAFFLTQNLIAFSNAKHKASNQQIKNYVDDIAMQLDAMNNVQSQLGKATYLYTRQAAQAVSVLKDNYSESQSALYKNITTLSNMQNKATKIMLKCDQSNTVKVISAIRDMRNNLNETMIQGFDQLQPNNDEMIVMLTEIVNYLKAHSGNIDQALSMQLNNVAHELQDISNSIQGNEMTSDITKEIPMQMEDVVTNNSIEEPIEEPFSPTFTVVGKSDEEDLMEEPEPVPTVEDMTDNPNKQLSPDEIAALFAAAEPTPKVEPEPVAPISDDPNKQLSPDEIAALFSSLG